MQSNGADLLHFEIEASAYRSPRGHSGYPTDAASRRARSADRGVEPAGWREAGCVEKVLAARPPTPVTHYLLHEGCATRISVLKQIAEDTNAILGEVRKAAEEGRSAPQAASGGVVWLRG